MALGQTTLTNLTTPLLPLPTYEANCIFKAIETSDSWYWHEPCDSSRALMSVPAALHAPQISSTQSLPWDSQRLPEPQTCPTPTYLPTGLKQDLLPSHIYICVYLSSKMGLADPHRSYMSRNMYCLSQTLKSTASAAQELSLPSPSTEAMMHFW